MKRAQEEYLEWKLFTPKQFAERLSISRSTFYNWITEGLIKSAKIGRLVRIPESEVRRIVRQGAKEVVER